MEAEGFEAYIAHTSNAIRIDLKINGKDVTKVFEKTESGVLEVEYDGDGQITQQKLVEPSREIAKEAEEYISEMRIGRLTAKPYSEVRINKKCPSCGSTKLERVKGESISIIPMYVCKSCGTRSYNLTREYLEALIKENVLLFSEEEQKELENDHEAFVAELSDYILKIYASKKIRHI